MAEVNDVFAELRTLVAQFEEQKKQIYVNYHQMVDDVLNDQIVTEREIEVIMDGLLDFCDDKRFLALYKDLCRHVYYKYPQLVGEHVNLFRLQFEENNS